MILNFFRFWLNLILLFFTLITFLILISLAIVAFKLQRLIWILWIILRLYIFFWHCDILVMNCHVLVIELF
jgi:hypothetical protein